MQQEVLPPRVTVSQCETKVVLTITKNPIPGLTQQQWLEKECRECFGSWEMNQYGARWRQRAQAFPRKLERVLGDVRVMQKEGRVIRNAGAYAEWLWKDWE